jgi:CheY-like chemotaxis protein
MTEQLHILCVDDEPKVLEGLVLNLRRHYRVSTANNGQGGLAIVDGNDPPAVVVSDMRMPEMDGAAFLSQVKERSPDTVRLLLTGQADLESAIAAVNHGQVFRFLTKPCNPPTLPHGHPGRGRAASAHHGRERAAGKDAAGKHQGSHRDSVSRQPAHLRARHAPQTACVGIGDGTGRAVFLAARSGGHAVPNRLHRSYPANNEKLYYGRPLTPVEAESTQCVPKISLQLLESIPRLELVCAILDAQEYNFDGQGSPRGAPQGESIPLGARVLKLVSDYDFLEAGGTSPGVAISTLQGRKGRYDPKLLGALGRVKNKAAPGVGEIKLAALQSWNASGPGRHVDHGLAAWFRAATKSRRPS